MLRGDKIFTCEYVHCGKKYFMSLFAKDEIDLQKRIEAMKESLICVREDLNEFDKNGMSELK